MLRALIVSALAVLTLHAETGRDAWLRYSTKYSQPVPAVVVSLGDSVVTTNARSELIRGIRSLTGKTLRIEAATPKEAALVLGTLGPVNDGAVGTVYHLVSGGDGKQANA